MSCERSLEKLRRLAYKLRCIGYFLETQDPNFVCPVDFDKVQYGFSLIINDISAEIVTITESIENTTE